MRLVVKTGSAVLSASEGGLRTSAVDRIASQLARIKAQGHEVILVSSGAIAAGSGRLGWRERPAELRRKQAAAAVGQLALMEAYENAFSRDNIIPAQVLLTRDDLMNRQRYLNIRTTLLELLALNTVPIINENDCVSTEEIQFGDNDTLAAAVATKVQADKLVLLSDVPGLYVAGDDGKLTKEIVPVVEHVTEEMEKKASRVTGSAMSAGGMSAKLRAARMATAAGIEVWIASGHADDILEKVLRGEPGAGTRFLPRPGKIGSRDAWIAFGRATKGTLVVDEGAERAIVQLRKSLLPSGVKSVRGNFLVGDSVQIKSVKSGEIGRGLVNFSSGDIKTIAGHHTNDIPRLLGRSASSEVIHRDNLVLL